MKALLLLLGFSLAACTSTNVIRDSEYKYSEAAYRASDPEKALTEFPKKENGGFVTSIEKSWIGLWAGKTNHDDLMKQAKTLDERKYTSVSREAQYFFMNESEEGYIPAEHEVILMHVLNAMYFMRANEWGKARVETKKASYFLETFFSPEQKHFDDPALRLWLAGLWSALGEWNEAQVDLRRAYQMTKDRNIKALLDLPSAPKDLSVVFQGAGPHVNWIFGEPLPHFTQRDDKIPYKITASTLPWYKRHQERNSLIRDKIAKSNYMSQYYGILLSTGSEQTLGFVAANTVRTAALVVGGAIVLGGIYLLVSIAPNTTNSGEAIGSIIGGGFLAGEHIWNFGNEISENFESSVRMNKEKGQEELKTYRFVRFLPSWISLMDAPIVNATGPNIDLKSPSSPTTVHFVQKF